MPWWEATFEQRHEGDEGISYGESWWKSVIGRENQIQRPWGWESGWCLSEQEARVLKVGGGEVGKLCMARKELSWNFWLFMWLRWEAICRVMNRGVKWWFDLFYFLFFIFLAASGLSCGTQDLSLRHEGSFIHCSVWAFRCSTRASF